MVDELINGTCIALEVRDPQGSFRQFCGPVDPVSNALKKSNCFLISTNIISEFRKSLVRCDLTL